MGQCRPRLMSGGVGNLHRGGTCGSIDALGLAAIGIALLPCSALVETGAEKPFALDLHGQLDTSVVAARGARGFRPFWRVIECALLSDAVMGLAPSRHRFSLS